MSGQEKKNVSLGILTSLGFHLGLFLIFFFLVAWRAPNPPLGDYGVELNFGLDDEGSGDIQPESPVGTGGNQKTEETIQPAESQADEAKKNSEDVKEVVADNTHEKVVSKEESPVTVKEEKKEERAKKEKQDDTKSKEKVLAEYKNKDTNVTDASRKGIPGNQGDDKNKVGDKGNPEGKLDAKALYGTPGGGGGGGDGFGLSMSGWEWAIQPKVPELPDNENGKVIFEIECDENGDIIGITTLERSLSPRTEQILKEEIRKNSLVHTSSARAPERSKGRITFILKTK